MDPTPPMHEKNSERMDNKIQFNSPKYKNLCIIRKGGLLVDYIIIAGSENRQHYYLNIKLKRPNNYEIGFDKSDMLKRSVYEIHDGSMTSF